MKRASHIMPVIHAKNHSIHALSRVLFFFTYYICIYFHSATTRSPPCALDAADENLRTVDSAFAK